MAGGLSAGLLLYGPIATGAPYPSDGNCGEGHGWTGCVHMAVLCVRSILSELDIPKTMHGIRTITHGIVYMEELGTIEV